MTAQARHAGGHCHLPLLPAKLRGATPPPQAGEAPTSRHPHFGLKPWEKLPPAAATLGNTQGSARTDPRHKDTRRRIRSGHRACKPEAQHEMGERSRSGAGEGPLRVQLPWSRAEPSKAELGRAEPSPAESRGSGWSWLGLTEWCRVEPSSAEWSCWREPRGEARSLGAPCWTQSPPLASAEVNAPPPSPATVGGY